MLFFILTETPLPFSLSQLLIMYVKVIIYKTKPVLIKTIYNNLIRILLKTKKYDKEEHTRNCKIFLTNDKKKKQNNNKIKI